MKSLRPATGKDPGGSWGHEAPVTTPGDAQATVGNAAVQEQLRSATSPPEVTAGLWMVEALTGCSPGSANADVRASAEKYGEDGVPTGLVDEALTKNDYHYTSGASSTTGISVPGARPRRAPGANLYLNESVFGAGVLAEATHEAAHDKMLRAASSGSGDDAELLAHIDATAAEYEGKSMLDSKGAAPTVTMDPGLALTAAHEAYAYWAAHQVKAQADAIDYARASVDGYLAGDLDETRLREGLALGEAAFNRAIHDADSSTQVHGRDDFVPPLSTENKAWAASEFMDGKVYETFWDIPAVQAQVARAGVKL